MTDAAHDWAGEPVETPRFERPVFIIAAPRSGSTVLFDSLRGMPGIWSIGRESHRIFDIVLQHHFGNPRFDSIRATGRDAAPEKSATLTRLFSRYLIEAGSGRRYRDQPPGLRPGSIRLLDKLPKNAFRVAFLAASFPDARFIFLSREPRGNISSLIDAWRHGRATGRFVTYRRLPDTAVENWCFVLPPGWRRYVDRPLAEIAAFQWMTANETALDDLLALPRDRWCAVSYEALVSQPAAQLRRLSAFIGVKAEDRDLGIGDGGLPVSRTALTPPDPEKWRANAAEMMQVLPQVEGVAERIDRMLTV
jgi:hypothetical protein